MSEANGNRLRLNDFLSGAYYAISITVILIGLVIYIVTINNKLNNLINHVNDLDLHGTRALSERVGILESHINASEAHMQILTQRTIAHEALSGEIGIISTKQIDVLRRLESIDNVVRELEGRVNNHDTFPKR